jgi:excisionase family DNA binding protein
MIHQKPRYRLEEAFVLLGTPRSTGYVAVKEGRLRIQKDGRRSFVTADELDRYVREECPPSNLPAPASHSFNTRPAA